MSHTCANPDAHAEILRRLNRGAELVALADALAHAVWRFTHDPERSHRDAGNDFEAMIDAAAAYRTAREGGQG